MSPSGHETLEVVGLSKRFGGLQVFQEISFALPQGEVLGVIGPNGAGKTTLINVISGKLAPTAGRVLLGRREMTGRPLHAVSRAGIMRSFQQTNTFSAASVGENISRAITFSGSGSAAWQAITGMLDEFELAPRLDEQSDKLPYGLQKMLGLVLAFVTRPKVMLLDEPAAGLEGRERGRVDSFVRHAREELGCSVLIVEHDMDLVRRLCPNILVLDAGRLLASGPPAEVLARKDVIDAYVGAVEEEVA
ncbi:ABC transporter ATP-binding protein [Chelatococcus asaccharovorans]|uniref:ABC transporter ATP-binding protein n=1 Tax=Chelatococcus asaccharovorans TaxID=28210 RepID=UPI00224C79D1|nr:ATP-binding cassette domain-containing protein [Chelatococcus asaccharovorans]CAH1663411.1 Branched-chain amino acid transport system ATP-binding protein [Chelatococcus asaccharovorans]CAH1682806.1 Branched-chain amino acid transport system ATP-binding protein [Chelatococcus asaccharovorans]